MSQMRRDWRCLPRKSSCSNATGPSSNMAIPLLSSSATRSRTSPSGARLCALSSASAYTGTLGSSSIAALTTHLTKTNFLRRAAPDPPWCLPPVECQPFAPADPAHKAGTAEPFRGSSPLGAAGSLAHEEGTQQLRSTRWAQTWWRSKDERRIRIPPVAFDQRRAGSVDGQKLANVNSQTTLKGHILQWGPFKIWALGPDES